MKTLTINIPTFGYQYFAGSNNSELIEQLKEFLKINFNIETEPASQEEKDIQKWFLETIPLNNVSLTITDDKDILNIPLQVPTATNSHSKVRTR